MVKLAIVSSKKYLKSKQAIDFLQYLDHQKISYDKLILEELANTISNIKGISNNNFDIDRKTYLNSKNEINKVENHHN